jgi:hypothetical protein
MTNRMSEGWEKNEELAKVYDEILKQFGISNVLCVLKVWWVVTDL